MPLGIDPKESNLTLDVRMLGAAYSGDLNAAATELSGTYTTAQGNAVPLTFRRAAPTVRSNRTWTH